MNVFYCIPSANAVKCNETFRVWRSRGYKTAVLLNGPAFDSDVEADHVHREQDYPGWGHSFNILARQLADITDVDLFVTGGDDMLPDPKLTADEICGQFIRRFPDGMGVLQPTGDKWMNNVHGICGSPFVGVNFALLWNGGRGAFFPDYVHHYADNELCIITKRYGLLWQRDDLTHYHDHFRRRGGTEPEYMRYAYSQNARDAALFGTRQANGFPGHEPI